MITDSDKYFLDLVDKKLVRPDFDSGIVYSRLSGKWKTVGAKQSAGYLHMSGGPTRQERNYILLHRLVWMVANGEVPDGMEVNHKDGNKHNNRLSNLELITRSDNVKHALRTLGKKFGFLSGKPFEKGARTSREKIDEIVAMFKSGIKNRSEIARRTGVKRPTVGKIIEREIPH